MKLCPDRLKQIEAQALDVVNGFKSVRMQQARDCVALLKHVEIETAVMRRLERQVVQLKAQLDNAIRTPKPEEKLSDTMRKFMGGL